MKDYYKILQIDPEAEPEVIQSAYRGLARKYHPNVDGSPKAAVRMKDLKEAYAVLSDAAKRAEYDHQRGPQARGKYLGTAAAYKATARTRRGPNGIAQAVLDRAQQTVALRLATPITARQVLLVSLLVAAVLTRFWRLGTPGEFYFDEVYFPKTGQEILRGDPAAWEFYGHENTHPPLSKLFMAGGMAILGAADSILPPLVPGSGGENNAFAWRFFGALAGVGSIVFAYLIAKRLFKSEIAGMAAAFLMTFEGLSFAQSRMATPDSYVLFFVLGAIYFTLSDRLFLSGVFLGAAMASKLTALFTVFPIVLYFLYCYWQTGQARGAPLVVYLAPLALLGFYLGTPAVFGGLLVDETQSGALQPDLSAPLFNAALGSWMALWALAPVAIYFIYRRVRSREGQEQDALATSLLTLPLFFVVVPLYVYLFTYIPMLLNGHGLEDVLLLNRDGYQFHTTLEATHPYQAPWDTWPIMMRPVFLYLGSTGAKIYNLGNPIIFWFGLPAVAFALWQGLGTLRAKLNPETGDVVLSGALRPNAGPLFVVLTFLGFWLPWAIQPRIMFIYHYLPAVTFVILALSYVIHRLWEQPSLRISAAPFAAVAFFLVAAAFTLLMLSLSSVAQPPWGRYGTMAFLAIAVASLLTLAWAYAMDRVWQQPWGRTVAIAFLAIVALTFVYFYPHLAAVSVSSRWEESFYWFSSWR